MQIQENQSAATKQVQPEHRPHDKPHPRSGDGSTRTNGDQPHGGHGEQPPPLAHISGMKLAVIFAVVVLVVVIAFIARIVPNIAHDRELRQQAQNEADAPPVVNVAYPTPQAVNEVLTLPADIRANQQTAIYARVDGYVGQWFVDIGDHVQKGQLLAVIDAPDTDAALAQARATLLQAKANLKSAQTNLTLANATYERYHGLLATGSVTQQDLDTRQTNASQAAAEEQADEAAVKSNQATVDRLASLQSFEKITAPFSGTITVRNYDLGARIYSSSTAPGSEMYDIADTDTLRIFVNVPQAYVTYIQVNQPVYFLSQRNYGTTQFTGYVARTAGALDPNTRTLLTQLNFDNSQHKLWAGMYGEVHINVHRDHPMLTVPTAAMLFESNGTQLAVVDDSNHLHFKKVVVGRDLGSVLEIVGGVTAQEQIVTNPGEKLLEGGEVQIASRPAAPPSPALATADPQPTTRVAQVDSDPPSGGASR